MKTYIITFAFIISFLCCKAQTVNINTYDSSEDRSGKYYKDIDGNFDNFLGTWENTTGNITFRVILYKTILPATESPLDFSKDQIEGKFYIIENLNSPDQVTVCQSEKYYPQTNRTWTSVINAHSGDGVFLGGWLHDNCVSNNIGVVSGDLEMTIQDVSASTLTAQWTVTKGKGISIQGHEFVIPTDVILTKVN